MEAAMKDLLIGAAVCLIVLYGLDSLLFSGRYTAAAMAIVSHVLR
jgi:hypothetical protein